MYENIWFNEEIAQYSIVKMGVRIYPNRVKQLFRKVSTRMRFWITINCIEIIHTMDVYFTNLTYKGRPKLHIFAFMFSYGFGDTKFNIISRGVNMYAVQQIIHTWTPRSELHLPIMVISQCIKIN